jgi:hypothetical protein
MTGVASNLGGLGEEFAKSARKASTFSAVKSLFANTGIALGKLRPAIQPITDAFAALISATAPFLPRIAAGFANIATKAANFVTTASKSGRVASFFQGAIDTLKTLGRILGNIGSIFGSVFKQAGVSGAGLLENIENLTGRFAAFLKTAQGSDVIAKVFATLGKLGDAFKTGLVVVLPIVGSAFVSLVGVLGRLAPTVGDLIVKLGELVGWFTKHKEVTIALAGAIGLAYAAIKTYNLYVKIAAVITPAWAIATGTAGAAATGASIGVRALGFAIRFAMGPVGIAIGVIAALTAVVVIAYKKNETFRNIVNGAWAAVKAAIKAVGDWFVNTLWPSLQRAYQQLSSGFITMKDKIAGAWNAVRGAIKTVGDWFSNTLLPSLKRAYDSLSSGFITMKDKVVGAWNGARDGIKSAFVSIRDNVFSPIANLITKTIPDAFRTGVAGIGKAWNAIKGLAAEPIKFVVETVINKAMIGTFNKVSGFFGGPHVDNVPLPAGIGDGPGHGAARPPAGPRTGDGFGDMASIITDPAKWIKGKVTGTIDRIGNHPFAKMLKGMSGKLLSSLIDKAKSLVSLPDASSGAMIRGIGMGTNGLQAGISGVLNALRAVFGVVPLISGFRPGATTLSGRTSYHASGRAIDIAPVRRWAEFIRAIYGPRLKELITPYQDLNMHNGKPHRYTGAVWNQHNFAGGNAHIHAALDDGGIRMLKPGYNVVPNWTGKLEPIAGPNAMAAMAGGGDIVLHFHGPVSSKQGAEDMVVAAIESARRKRRI